MTPHEEYLRPSYSKHQWWPVEEREREQIVAIIEGIPAEDVSRLLARRGYPRFRNVMPERRVSVATGILWDYCNGR